MLQTPLTKLLKIPHPILQGGMAWVATWELAAAVSNAGSLGIIGAGSAPASFVREQITQLRRATDKPFGVNVPLFNSFADEVIAVCIEERISVMTTGAGNPVPYIEPLKSAGIIVIPVVASTALARRLERSGADALIAEGEESGGHIGTVSTLALVPQVVDTVSIPVIAAGGIADGRGLAAALALGAAGVQMGTRFIATDECIAHPLYKEAIVKANERSTMVTGYSLGHPVRSLRNQCSIGFEELERRGTSEEEVIAFGTGRLRAAVIDGDVINGSLMAGQSAGMVHDIVSAQTVIERTVAQAQALLATAPQYVVEA
ncbi:MAG: enoyl-[acyl-carrier-protein] reductase FabK [Chloroflexi bacterium]|nr:enoyl-[acyl-carrier-protein] reductase FabK [Chloroflexota bacterium]